MIRNNLLNGEGAPLEPGSTIYLINTDIRHLPIHEQLFSYADAYRNASAALCQRMTAETSYLIWPNGAVVLMLAAHSVELFLKGVLLKLDPGQDVWRYGHNINVLAEACRSQFPLTIYDWDIPFSLKLSEQERADLIDQFGSIFPSEQIPAPSILYRYPVDKGGVEWRGIHAFEPNSFSELLTQMERDFKRIRSKLYEESV